MFHVDGTEHEIFTIEEDKRRLAAPQRSRTMTSRLMRAPEEERREMHLTTDA